MCSLVDAAVCGLFHGKKRDPSRFHYLASTLLLSVCFSFTGLLVQGQIQGVHRGHVPPDSQHNYSICILLNCLSKLTPYLMHGFLQLLSYSTVIVLYSRDIHGWWAWSTKINLTSSSGIIHGHLSGINFLVGPIM